MNFEQMNRFSLCFNDSEVEEKYQLASEPMRKMQMRLALILASLLYFIVLIIDPYILPEALLSPARLLHLSEAMFLLCSALYLFYFPTIRLSTFLVIATVFTAWTEHLFIAIHGGANLIFGEAYLMIIWLWLVSGLSLSQSATLSLLFIAMFEVAVALFSPYSFNAIISHHYFVFVAILIGALGAYITEFYKRQNFLSLEKISRQASSLNTLSLAVEQSGEGILITDHLDNIEYVNPAFTNITGYTAADVIGRSPGILSDEQQSIFHHLRETIEQGKVWHGSLSNKKKDGSYYTSFTSISPILDAAGNIIHHVATQQDITKYQHLENQLRQTQKMEAIGRLVGGIAHDFNNTLAGITGHIFLAKENAQHLPEAVESLSKVERLAFRSADIIKQLLAFSRKGVVSMKTMDLGSFLTATSQLHRVTLPADIEFQHHLNAADLVILGDANQLEQVIINLLNNARDALKGVPNPMITLQLEKCYADEDFKKSHPELAGDDFACISVIDNGCGIQDDALEYIFEPFYTTKGVHEGTGLGLSMVYGTIQSHGGTVAIHSDPAFGTSIQLYLPLLKETVSDHETQTDDTISKGLEATILLADDNESVLEISRAILERLGCRVLSACDGIQAIELYAQQHHNIQMVILDMVMPKMGGIAAAQAMREINPDVNIIFITGYEPTQHFNHNEECAPEIVIRKPFNVAQFSRLVKSSLENEI